MSVSVFGLFACGDAEIKGNNDSGANNNNGSENNTVLSEFEFTETDGGCTITGVKDKTVLEVIIPDTVTSVADEAFSGCTNLTSITFNGTKAQWQAISKSYAWNYNDPTSCIIHCTDGDLNI